MHKVLDINLLNNRSNITYIVKICFKQLHVNAL